MTCEKITIPSADGPVTAIVCRRGSRRTIALCSEPHCSKPHDKLCDYPVQRNGRAGTCDRALCEGHSVAVGPDRDYCMAHARASKATPFDRELFHRWCAYFWRTESFDRAGPHVMEGDTAYPTPEAHWASQDHARKVRRELRLVEADREAPERLTASRLKHEAIAQELTRAGWRMRGDRLVAPNR